MKAHTKHCRIRKKAICLCDFFSARKYICAFHSVSPGLSCAYLSHPPCAISGFCQPPKYPPSQCKVSTDKLLCAYDSYSWSYDVFRTSLLSYVAAGLGPYTIVIDNSQDRRIVKDPDVRALGLSDAHAAWRFAEQQRLHR